MAPMKIVLQISFVYVSLTLISQAWTSPIDRTRRNLDGWDMDADILPETEVSDATIVDEESEKAEETEMILLPSPTTLEVSKSPSSPETEGKKRKKRCFWSSWWNEEYYQDYGNYAPPPPGGPGPFPAYGPVGYPMPPPGPFFKSMDE